MKIFAIHRHNRSQGVSHLALNEAQQKRNDDRSLLPCYRGLLATVLSGVCCLSLIFLPAKPVLASDPCNPPNVIPQSVCDMDSFHGSPPRQVPDGWTDFMLSGDADFTQESDTYWGPPSLMIRNSGGTFKGGIFTQVQVTPGQGYRASCAWGAPNAPDQFGRQLGIDPTGGTDPNSPNIVWGPMHWGPGRILNYPPPDVNIDVKARAVNSTITVFFLTDHPQSTGDNLIFIDAIALYPDDSAPAAAAPPPTNTPEPTAVPPTDAPAVAAASQQVQAAAVVEQPADTPTAPPTETFTPAPTDTPTAVPTATFTPTPSPTPTPTFTATWTPYPTVTPGDSLAQVQLELVGSTAGGRPPLGLLALGLLGFSGAGVFGGSLWRLRRR